MNLKYLGAKVYYHSLRLYVSVGHLIGKLNKKYYFEDYVRVYPDGIVYDAFGVQSKADRMTLANYLNHVKVYQFAAQFVQGKCVADVGCGSGYGCEILKKAGAAQVYGCDVSTAAIKFAKSRYADFAQFTIQGMTDLYLYPDACFDVTLSSEVLEHVKEYGVEEKAILELKRITRDGGLLIIGTPNSELLGDHGFYFDEINSLFKNHFARYVIFENALVPFDKSRGLWEKRVAEGKVGVIVSEHIDRSETCISEDATVELKKGIEAGIYRFAGYDVDTTLLHNTHSWLVLAVKQ